MWKSGFLNKIFIYFKLWITFFEIKMHPLKFITFGVQFKNYDFFLQIKLLILSSFSSAFSSCFLLTFFSYAWLIIFLFLTDISDNAVLLAFSFKTFECAFKVFVFTNFNRRQSSHHLLGLNFTFLLYSSDIILSSIFTKFQLQLHHYAHQ